MCNSKTKLTSVKIFYRKPRYTHYCSVWNIILSSLYQKCMIWIEVHRQKSSQDKGKLKRGGRILFPKFTAYQAKAWKSAKKPLNWSRKRHLNFTWLPNRWPTWRATGIRRTATAKPLIRWNLRGMKSTLLYTFSHIVEIFCAFARVFGLNWVHSTGLVLVAVAAFLWISFGESIWFPLGSKAFLRSCRHSSRRFSWISCHELSLRAPHM